MCPMLRLQCDVCCIYLQGGQHKVWRRAEAAAAAPAAAAVHRLGGGRRQGDDARTAGVSRQQCILNGFCTTTEVAVQ